MAAISSRIPESHYHPWGSNMMCRAHCGLCSRTRDVRVPRVCRALNFFIMRACVGGWGISNYSGTCGHFE